MTALASAEVKSERNRRAGTWQRFRTHRLALFGFAALTLMTVLAIGAPVFAQHGPSSVNLASAGQPPSTSHLLGVDAAGRDVLSRLLHAGRVSLSVGIVAVAISSAIGIALGATAGFFGGWVDSLIMRLVDIVLAFPNLIIIITVVSVLGASLLNLMLVIGLLGWPPIARLLRGDLLSIRERDFIVAARATGVPGFRLVFRHLLPNAMAPIIVAATFGVASAILLEAGLSFLGLGVQPPTASWGNMLTSAQSLSVLESMPWLWIPPGFMIAVAVLAINFIGDGLRDALDPYLVR